MNNNHYEIISFKPKFMDEVIQLLRYLWGDNHESNLFYFQWKYTRNPFTDHTLGIIALYNGHAVGFRGYFATKWILSETNKNILVLCPGDTVVHPDHRRKNLSVLMGNKAKKKYSDTYPLFFNFSASRNSTPGYLKMGFVPIVDKVYLNCCNLLDLIKYIVSVKEEKSISSSSITFGNFNNIEVSNHPKPKSMSALISSQKNSNKKIRLLKDEAFFKWRFKNGRIKYVFYYYNTNKNIIGYLIVRLSKNNRRGYIVDYAANSASTLKELLTFVKDNKHFNIISIYSYSISDIILPTLELLNFESNNLAGLLEKKTKGIWPLFIRPVKNEYTESDFFFHGIDIRKFQNWSIKEINSDAS